MTADQIEQTRREWLEYIDSRQPHLLREALTQSHPGDLIDVMRTLDDAALAELLRLMEDEQIATLFRYLNTDTAMRLRLLEQVAARRRPHLMGGMSAEAAAETVKALDPAARERFLDGLTAQRSATIESLLKDRKTGVDMLMTTDFMTVRSDAAVRQVVGLIHNMEHTEGRSARIYVTDHRGLLCGMIDLHLLLKARDSAGSVEAIMRECPLRIRRDADALAAARSILHYGVAGAPVVNSKNELLGVITADAAFRLLEADQDANINCIGVVGGVLDRLHGETPRVALRHSLALLPVMLAALAAAALLHALFFLRVKTGPAALLPYAPMFVAVNRLYYRHVTVLLQKRSLAEGIGVVYHRRRVNLSVFVGLAFAPLSGAAAYALTGGHAQFGLFTAGAAAWSVLTGAALAWLLSAATERTRASRAAALTPAVLSLSDLIALAAIFAVAIYMFR